MPAAYTGYKLSKTIQIVFGIFLVLAILSVINPAKQEAVDKIIKETDAAGIAPAVAVINNIPDPKGQAEQYTGNFLWRLMENNPQTFIGLVLLVSVALFIVGVRLKTLRGYQRGLMR